MENELVVIKPESALTVFTTDNAIDPYLAKIRQEIDSFVADVSTKKGREAIASIAYKVSKSKTYLESVGKELADKQKEIPKRIDASRKFIRDTLGAWKDEVRKPLTDWETAEQERQNKISNTIRGIAVHGVGLGQLTLSELNKLLSDLNFIVIDSSFEEFEAEAHIEKQTALTALNDAIAKRTIYEAEQVELLRLRAEAEERARKDRDEQIRRDAEVRALSQAEEVAKREKEVVARREQESAQAAEKRELELRLQAEKSERERLEAEQRAERAAREAQENLLRQQKAEKERADAELAKREADKKHAASIHNKALDALVKNGLDKESAKLVITAIAKGLIPNVKIQY